MKLTLALIAGMVVAPAFAHEGFDHDVDVSPLSAYSTSFAYYALWLEAKEAGSNYKAIATLGASGCIRGPFVLRDNAGNEVFRLATNATYPKGCDK